MAYLFRQKLNISELVDLAQAPKRILIHEPEEYLSALYAHYLRAHNFDVKHCPNWDKISAMVKSFRPQVFIFSADALVPHTNVKIWGLLSGLVSDFPNLKLISTGLGNSSPLKELMAAGVLGHINRKLSRPQDLAIIVKSIL